MSHQVCEPRPGTEASNPPGDREECPTQVCAPPPEDAARAGSRFPHIPGYDIVGLLGRGGMGIVYLARHRKLNRLVAIKTILGGSDAGPLELARFLREAQAVARLQH